MAQRLALSVAATSDAAGNVTFNFNPTPPGQVDTGTVYVDGAPAALASVVRVGGVPWGPSTGGQALQVQAVEGESVSITATGAAASTQYTAWFTGSREPYAKWIATGFIYPFPAPPARSPGAATGALAFQHNDVAVASEPGADFEDSASVLWTLTDDPGSSRVKVSAAATGGGGGISAMHFAGDAAQTVAVGSVTDLNWLSSGVDEGSSFAHIDGTHDYIIDFDATGYYGFDCIVQWNIGGLSFNTNALQTSVQTFSGVLLATLTDVTDNTHRGFNSAGSFIQTPAGFAPLSSGATIVTEVQQFIFATPIGFAAAPVLRIVKLA